MPWESLTIVVTRETQLNLKNSEIKRGHCRAFLYTRRCMAHFRNAALEDVPSILPLMREFYDFEQLPYNESRATKLLTQLLNDSNCGRLVVIEHESVLAGYMVIGFGFSIEFGGKDALLDELFVVSQFRGLGIGSQAIAFAISLCKLARVEALHLEADHFNERAHDLYLRLGFKDHKRHLMTKWL
jgi:GNAT superfamily N-acetyltransferase